MKTMITALIAATTLAAAAPAGAQAWRYDERGQYNLNAREAMLRQEIDRGLRNGSINRSEAIMLRNSLRNVERIESRYRRGGLSGWERRDLDARLDRVAVDVRRARSDWDRPQYRGYRYDNYDYRIP